MYYNIKPKIYEYLLIKNRLLDDFDVPRSLDTKHKTAAGPGLEPRYPGPKPGVLPLDDPAIIKLSNTYSLPRNQQQSLKPCQILSEFQR